MKLPMPLTGDGLRMTTQTQFNGFQMLSTEGGICDMENMTSDYWPEMASRPKRKILRHVNDPRGFTPVGDDFIFASGRDLFWQDMYWQGVLENVPVHDFVWLGDWLTVWPEGSVFDFQDRQALGTFGQLQAELTRSGVRFLSSRAPDGISDEGNCIALGDLGPGIDEEMFPFREGDAVTISGCAAQEKNNQTVIIRKILLTQVGPHSTYCNLYTLDGGVFLDPRRAWMADGTYVSGTAFTFTLPYFPPVQYTFTATETIAAGDFLILDETAQKVILPGGTKVSYTTGVTGTAVEFTEGIAPVTEAGEITLTRAVPEMDFVFEHGNRLWGAKGDTIYASKLGDPFNWNVFDGIASDSWSVEAGTAGDFTAGISYGGYPRFFKEDQIFTVYGETPDTFSLQRQDQMGAAAGSGRSPVVINSALYYMSWQGPCVYAGGAPRLIADAFGVKRYRNGLSGTDGVKWYLALEDEDGQKHLFVYDTEKRFWVREDDLRPVGFAYKKGDVYALGTDGDLRILGRPLNAPADAADEGDVEWMAEFGDITSHVPNRKRANRILLRVEMEEKTGLRLLIKYDSEERWREVGRVSARKKRSAVVPVIPRRLDHFKLRIEGTGACRISSLSIEAAGGSTRR